MKSQVKAATQHMRMVGIAIAVLVATLLLGITIAQAMPPHARLAEKIATGAVRVPNTNLQANDSWVHAQRLPLRNQFSASAADSFNTLAILIQYSDEPSLVNAVDFDTLLYSTGQGSVRDYYLECSYGNLDMITINLPSSTGWQSAPQTAAYYANGQNGLVSSSYPNNAKKLVEDAVAAADPLVDFSKYDNDNDGWVDALMIIHTGPGAEFTGSPDDIWSHKWGISPQNRDGVQIGTYTMMPEYWSSPGDITIGVFAHELGHAFGLPDLYDTDYSANGLGRWCLMSGGAWNGILGNSPAHFSAWCKVQLGFTTPISPATELLAAPFPQVETDSVVYRLWDNSGDSAEYFLAENRQRTGFDAGIPSSGILVWHIDESQSGNRNEWFPGNTGSGHQLVALEQADGDWDLETSTNSGDSGDPYPGSNTVRNFNATTTPNSLTYTGSVSFVLLANISDSDSLMTADITVSLTSDIGDDRLRPNASSLVRNYPNPFNASTRIEVSVDQPGPLNLVIYNVLGQPVRSFESPFVSAGLWAVNWDGRDARGVALSSGVYWYRVHLNDARHQGKMVMLK
jgi:M6 family metalloprotease-like protein